METDVNNAEANSLSKSDDGSRLKLFNPAMLDGDNIADYLIYGTTTPKNRTSTVADRRREEEEQQATYVIDGKCVVAEAKSLFVLPPNSLPRIFASSICHSKLFENLILLTILTNSIIIALVDYRHVDKFGNPSSEGSWRNEIYISSNFAFVMIFLVECIIRVTSLGFIGSHGSYMSDYWNWLDLIVVLMGCLSFFDLNYQGVMIIRLLRTLRPLRFVHEIPSLQRIVRSILTSLPYLGSVFLFLGFILIIYAIIGVQLFSGNYFHSRCRATPFPVKTSYIPYSGLDYDLYRCLDEPNFNSVSEKPQWLKEDSPWAHPQDCYWPLAARFAGIFGRNSSNANSLFAPYTLRSFEYSTANERDSPRFCSIASEGESECLHDDSIDEFFWSWCGSSYDAMGNNRFVDKSLARSDVYIANLVYGYINFDDFGYAIINIFQSITLEGWTANMGLLIDAYDTRSAVVYYLSLVIIGSCFVVQLLLAVLEDTYNEQCKEENKEKDKLKEGEQVIDGLENTDKDTTTTNSIKSSPGALVYNNVALNNAFLNVLEVSKCELPRSEKKRRNSVLESDVSSPLDYVNETVASSLSSLKETKLAKVSGELLNALDRRTRISRFISALYAGFVNPKLTKEEREEMQLPIRLRGFGFVFSLILGMLFKLVICVMKTMYQFEQKVFSSIKETLPVKLAADIVINAIPLKDVNHPIRLKCRQGVESYHFQLASASLILINCIILAIDHYPASSTFLRNIDIINISLTLLFCLELLLRFFAYGVYKFLFPKDRDLFNIFDATIVIASVIELIANPPPILGGSSPGAIISVLRCFRLFRFYKLLIVLKFETTRVLLVRVAMSFLELRSFMVLLILFLFISALLGMQLFANKFRFDGDGEHIPYYSHSEGNEPWRNAVEVPRYNFDDFSSSVASSFQILTTENWNIIMINAWRSSGVSAIAFPFAIIAIGTYVLMNLYLAILLNAFTKRPDKATANEEADNELYSSKSKGGNNISGGGGDNDMPEHHIHHFFPNSILNFIEASPGTTGETKVDVLNSEKVEKVDEVEEKRDDETSNFLEKGGKKDFPEKSLLKESISDKTSSSINSIREHKLEKGSSSGGGGGGGVEMLGRNIENKDDLLYKTKRRFSKFLHYLVGGGNDTKSGTSTNRSLFLFSETSRLRMMCNSIVSSKKFEVFVVALVIISSITLIFETPLLDPESESFTVLKYVNIIITILFTLEFLLKVIAFGFLFREGAYLRDGWNMLDFIIIVLSQISLLSPGNEMLRTFKVIRALRALRPLRMIRRAPSLKMLVNSMISSLPDMLHVLLVVLTVDIVFSIFFVNFLKGDLRACQGALFDDLIAPDASYMRLLEKPSRWGDMTLQQKQLFGPMSPFISSSDDMSIVETACQEAFPYTNWLSSPKPCCVVDIGLDNLLRTSSSIEQLKLTSKDVCLCWGGQWDFVSIGVFDSVPLAILNLLQISTTEGWVDLMYAAVDSTGVDSQPIRNNRSVYIYAFIIFMVVSNFFALNLFIGVLMDNFIKQKENHARIQHGYMTVEQFKWVKTQEVINKLSPTKRYNRPNGKVLKVLFDIIFSASFEFFILGCIFANTIVLALNYFGQGGVWETNLVYANQFFSFLFAAEALLKISVLGRGYFHGFWNFFDFVIVLGTGVGILLYLGFDDNSLMLITIARLFRALRVVRLIRGLPTTKRMFDTIVLTIPSLLNITGLLILIIFIYAVLGMHLFSLVHFNGSYDQHTNFRTFGMAMLTLARFTTGEAWGVFMDDVATKTEGCSEDPQVHKDSCGWTYYNNINYFSSDMYSTDGYSGYEIVRSNLPCRPIDGCGSDLIYPYMYSFACIMSVCLFNLFVGIVIEGFQDASFTKNKYIKPEQFDKIIDHWSKFDHEVTYYLAITDLEEFLRTLEAPFGFGEEMNGKKVVSKRVLQQMIVDLKLDVAVYRDSPEPVVHFRDVMMGISTYLMERETKSNFQDLRDTVGKNIIREKNHLQRALNRIKKGKFTPEGIRRHVPTTLGLKTSRRRAVARKAIYNTNELFAARKVLAGFRSYMKLKKKKLDLANRLASQDPSAVEKKKAGYSSDGAEESDFGNGNGIGNEGVNGEEVGGSAVLPDFSDHLNSPGLSKNAGIKIGGGAGGASGGPSSEISNVTDEADIRAEEVPSPGPSDMDDIGKTGSSLDLTLAVSVLVTMLALTSAVLLYRKDHQ